MKILIIGGTGLISTPLTHFLLERGDDVTLKRFYPEGAVVRLQPSNPAMEPLRVPAADLRIQGIVVGLMRKY